MKPVTIKDIAHLAGVSKGTVDRVLHKRGKVSAIAYQKVSTILETINYRPNLFARSLKNRKKHYICVVIPNYKEDAFWLPCFEGIRESVQEYYPFDVIIEPYLYDPKSATNFTQINNKVLALRPDAVLLAPLYYKETITAISKYAEKKIIISTFNSQLDTVPPHNFVGQDLFKSGRIAAHLLEMVLAENAIIAVIHVDEEFSNAIHMQAKEAGFRNYFSSKIKGNHSIVTCNSTQTNLTKNMNTLFHQFPNITGVFVTNSKVYKIADYINKKNIKNLKVIGYDLLDENIAHLNTHIIDFLIYQNPKKQVYLSLKYLAEYFIFEKTIPVNTALPIDIVNSENLSTYLKSDT
jgi:LacI family transcriptional regulator